MVLSGAVAAKDRALVEFVALVEEAGCVGCCESEAEKAGDGKDGELHLRNTVLDIGGWERLLKCEGKDGCELTVCC